MTANPTITSEGHEAGGPPGSPETALRPPATIEDLDPVGARTGPSRGASSERRWRG